MITIVDLTGDSEDDNEPTGGLSCANTTSRATSRPGFSAEEPIDLDPDDTDPPKAANQVNSQTEMASLQSWSTEERPHASQTRATESRSINVQDDALSSNSHLPTRTEIFANPTGAVSQSTSPTSPDNNLTLSRKRKRFVATSSDDNHFEEVNDETIFEPAITSSIEPREPLLSQTSRQLRIQNLRRKQGSEDTSVTGDLVFGSTPILDVSDSDAIAYKYVTDTLRNHIQDLRISHQYFTKIYLKRARTCFNKDTKRGDPWTKTCVPDRLIDKDDAFKAMKPIGVPISSTKAGQRQTTSPENIGQGEILLCTQQLFTETGAAKDKRVHQVPTTRYNTNEFIMPAYLSYVSLSHSILAENDKKFLVWPRLGASDEADKDFHARVGSDGGSSKFFGEHGFSSLVDQRMQYLNQLHSAWKYGEFVQKWLQEIGTSENDVLDYLLDQREPGERSLTKEALAFIPSEDRKVVMARKKSCMEDFDRKHRRWVDLRSRLTAPTARSLAAAMLACTAFLKTTDISLWQVLRFGQLVTELLDTSREEAIARLSDKKLKDGTFEYRDVACRICGLHACPYHGRVLEIFANQIVRIIDDRPNPRPEGKHKDAAGLREYEATRNNLRSFVTGPDHHISKRDDLTESSFNVKYWTQESGAWKIKERKTFYPCDHKGSCEHARCRCFLENILCEKLCGCSKSCERRFPGCQCARKGKTCVGRDSCLCWVLRRECDPELCRRCGVFEVLDPVNRYPEDEEWLESRCKNCYIQRNVPKKTWLAQSQIEGAGFGLYAGVDIKKDEYIGEYKGEIISSTELKRREVVDDRTYYLFDLSSDQTVDASTKGNKMRFINNSSKFDNCVGQNILCDQQIRIGMYALKDIKAGEEFFFNYNWPTHVQEHLEFGDLDGERKIAPVSRSKKGHSGKGKEDRSGKPRMTAAAKKTRDESVSSTTTTPSLNSRDRTMANRKAVKSSSHFQSSSTHNTQDHQLDRSDSEDEDYEEYEDSETSEIEFDEDEDESMPDADE